ncbi:hypothetical protein [Sphingomonas sp. PB4P5]|uniref:hypothetical protein n=1 Tax=Parasphingomonas puruogangriensis TaxID=3096155 RepID=UPI002FC89EEF
MRNARLMRRILGIVLGAAAALAILAAIEAAAHWLYPVALDYEALDRAALARAVALLPLAAKLLVLLGWFAATFGGAWLALRVCDWRWSGWIIALVIVTGNVATLLALPHPLWMQVSAIVAPLAGAWLARRVHHKPYKGEPLLG